MRLLTRQAGIVNFAPLRPYFLELYEVGGHVGVFCGRVGVC